MVIDGPYNRAWYSYFIFIIYIYFTHGITISLVSAWPTAGLTLYFKNFEFDSG